MFVGEQILDILSNIVFLTLSSLHQKYFFIKFSFDALCQIWLSTKQLGYQQREKTKFWSGKVAKYLGLNRLAKLFEIIRVNGGIKNTYLKLYRNDDLKLGTLVGTDKYGNKYFENPYYFYGRNRWIEFADHVGMEYDGSQIPAEWYGWMHYKTDLPPCRDGSRPKYTWMADHSQNHSGTTDQYYPYSTTRPKIEAWDPTTATKESK